MKIQYAVLSAVLVVCGACTKQSVPALPLQRVMTESPIQPIRLTGDSTHIYLTDYVPSLDSADWDMAYFDASEYDYLGSEANLYLVPDEHNYVPLLTLAKDDNYLSIVALPAIPQIQGMFTTACTENTISFSFSQVPQNPNFTIMWQNTYIQQPDLKENANCYTLTIPNYNHSGRSFIRIYAADDNYLYNELLIPLQDMKPVTDAKCLTRHDHQAQVLYSLMVDRFLDGNQNNNKKMNTPEVLDIVDYQGGDFAGITQKIEEGFFSDLGITTLWLSPVAQNPWDAWGYYEFKGKPCKYKDINGNQPTYTKFSAYHGYWPIYITAIEQRFGTEQEFKKLLETAHKHNINVILDYVANHMHISSPTLQLHPDWQTDSILPDGRRNFELWDEQRLTTWFDSHIPSLDLEREDVYSPLTDSALFWVENYDIDGFRHDACKHIPECYWRTLTKKIKTRAPQKDIWMIGETYGNPQLISSYVKSGMLDAQFDFNIYHTAIDVFGRDYSMTSLSNVINESLHTYGSHHTMGNISGNHDKARFISLAGGALSWDEDHKEAGWTRNVGVGDSAVAYRKAILLQVLNLTIPGVPCIYQGDEYAESGANDPDNRHMLRFCGYSKAEEQFLMQVKELIQLRRNNMPLLYGDYLPVYVDDDVLCFDRIYMGQTIRVVINKAEQAKRLDDLNLDIEPLSYLIIQ